MGTHKGSCHCGKVTFEFDNPIKRAVECNCSICRRKGALWHAVESDQFRIIAGVGNLSVYQFGTKIAKHFFCKHCGTSTFSNPRIAPTIWAINLRCVDGLDLELLTRQKFDGQNWEQAARDFLKTRRVSDAD